MRDFAITPSIAVTIGRQTRLYHAFVTTAPAALDSPSTLTLYLSTLADVAGFAATPVDARQRRGASRRTAGARRRQRTRLAARPLPRQSPHLRAGRSRAGRPHHAPALAVAATQGSRRSRQPPATGTRARRRSKSHDR